MGTTDHPERKCTRCMLDRSQIVQERLPSAAPALDWATEWCAEVNSNAVPLATVVCTAADGLQWFACDKPEHQAEYGDPSTPTRTTPIAEWFAQLFARDP
jgi:hypothetical protein